ncbi:MAG TPA: hypothetical protein VF774_23960 [Pseudoduganella sp.]
MQRYYSYLANNYRVTIINGHCFDSDSLNQKKSEVFTWNYQVTALVTDIHQQVGSKFC